MIIASRPSQKPSPSVIASAPVKTPVMFTCGAHHTVNSRRGVPYRRSSGIGAMPWVSTERSPAPLGVLPLNGGALRAPDVICLSDHGAGRPDDHRHADRASARSADADSAPQQPKDRRNPL